MWPYSTYASKKFGSFMISDRTLGQMMWLGNNDLNQSLLTGATSAEQYSF